jgi:hypothetical protein
MGLFQSIELAGSAIEHGQCTTGTLLASHSIYGLLNSEWNLVLPAGGDQNESLILVKQTSLMTEPPPVAWRGALCLYLVLIFVFYYWYCDCFKSIISLLQPSPGTNKNTFRNACVLHFCSVFISQACSQFCYWSSKSDTWLWEFWQMDVTINPRNQM